jgi:uracil-DNA glycosylase
MPLGRDDGCWEPAPVVWLMTEDKTPPDKAAALTKVAEQIEQCAVCRDDTIGRAVPGEGNPDAAIVFVGEAPGKREAETGRPFVAQSGRVLDRLLTTIGLRRQDIYLTSPVKYLPRRGTPTREQIEHGREHLRRQLDIINPRLVVLMGRVAARALLDRDVAVTKEHGRIIEHDGRRYFLTFHPAAVLHNPALAEDLEQDVQTLQDLARDEVSSSHPL